MALFTTGALPKRPVALVVSIVGFAISLVWTAIQHRAIAWLKFYEAVMSELERIHLRPPVALTGRREQVGGMPVRPIMLGCPFVSFILWALSVWWFFTHP